MTVVSRSLAAVEQQRASTVAFGAWQICMAAKVSVMLTSSRYWNGRNNYLSFLATGTNCLEPLQKQALLN
jgi:hypothetical protein